VCNALRDAGLLPEWNGDANSRIRLRLHWQRRAAWLDAPEKVESA
jgi:hypothetical protein